MKNRGQDCAEINILTPEQIAAAHNPYLTVSAFNAGVAIVGWNLRNVAFDPMYQHIIHAGIGLAERAGSICCGYGAAGNAAPQQTIDLTSVSMPDEKETEDALTRIEANLKMSADELKRLREVVMGDASADGDTRSGEGDGRVRIFV